MAKGVKGENCNVTACQKPKSAHHYNSATKAYYCKSCAMKIEAAAIVHDVSFYEGLGITKENSWRWRR